MPGFLDFDDDDEPDERKPEAAPAQRAGVNLDFDEDALQGAEQQPEQPAREEGTGNSWLDSLLGLEEGATLGRFRDLAGFGGLGSSGAGRLFDLHDENTAKALETPAGKVGRGVGTVGTAAALSAAAGPAVGAQAALGAGLGANEAGVQSDDDLMTMLAAMPAGAALGAAGGALGGRMGQSMTPQRLGASALVGGSLGALTSPGDPIGGAARGAATGVAGRALLGAAPQSMGAPIRALGAGAAAGAGALTGALSPAFAQGPDVAYGTAPTMAWAVESVLSSGSAGLEPADEQRLTEAALSGDKDKLISANFALMQRNPAYAARLQRELESLQEED
jgi:hypothetical protein